VIVVHVLPDYTSVDDALFTMQNMKNIDYVYITGNLSEDAYLSSCLFVEESGYIDSAIPQVLQALL
jgi:hypothetical protein